MKRLGLLVAVLVLLAVVAYFFLLGKPSLPGLPGDEQRAEDLVAGLPEVKQVAAFDAAFKQAPQCAFVDFFSVVETVFAAEGLEGELLGELRAELEKDYPRIQACSPSVKRVFEKGSDNGMQVSYFFQFPASCTTPSSFRDPVLVVRADLKENTPVVVEGSEVSEENRRGNEQLLQLTGNCAGPFLALEGIDLG